MNKPLKRDRYSRLEFNIYLVSWLLILALPLLIELYNSLAGAGFSFLNVLNAEFVLLPVLLLFLLNNFVLLPDLFFRNRKIWYFIVIVACFAILWFIQTPPVPRHIDPARPRPPFDMFHITNLIIEICVLLANFAIKVYIHSLRRDMTMLNVLNDKMHSELESLKSQISPHFLMNTLNNIQSLIESDPSRAYYTIQGLSRMMRYMLYENNSVAVPLQQEVDFITNFIDLMKMRYPENVKVSVQLPVECAGASVPPLIYLSFLENTFKHGVSYIGESFVCVNLSIENSRIVFSCANSKNSLPSRPQSHRGIGIENVKRRLQLIYGDDFTMKISDSEQTYMVEISIPLTIKDSLL